MSTGVERGCGLYHSGRCWLDVVVEGVLAQGDLEQATPMTVIGSLKIESNRYKGLDTRNGDYLRPEGDLGGQLLLGSFGHGEEGRWETKVESRVETNLIPCERTCEREDFMCIACLYC